MSHCKSMVEFVLENFSDGLGRLGRIKKWAGKTVDLATPTFFLHTQAGHVPHLSHDLLAYAGISVEKSIFQLTLPSFVHNLDTIQMYGKGFAAYVGLPSDASTMLCTHDPATPMISGFNDKNGISISGSGGRFRVTEPMMQILIENLNLDCVQIMADSDLKSNSSEKRIGKAVERSKKFLDSALQATNENRINSLFGTLTGGFDVISRCVSCSSLIEQNLAGYVIEGLHHYGNLENFCVSSVSILMTKFLNHLPPSKLRIFFGAFDPAQIFDLIRLNVDIFDTSYVFILTESHRALEIDYEKFPDQKNWFSLVDITNDELAQDFDKLVENCQCYTCVKYTKAYLYHLNKTSELLEYVLLMIHNLYQYTRYFEFLRNHMESAMK